MSQSDYINYKKTATVLENQSNLPSVLSPQDYTTFRAFEVMNTTYNHVTKYNLLTPSGTNIVYNMARPDASGCTEFTLCTGTDGRPNRAPTLDAIAWRQTATPTYVKAPSTKYCAHCCYNSAVKKTNGANTLLSKCSNRRLAKMFCTCFSPPIK